MVRLIAFVAPVLIAGLSLAACDSGASDSVQESASPETSPSAQGEIDRSMAGTQLPTLSFADPDGNTLDLAAIDGPVLVNLWATWCAPCVTEMPMLDALAGQMEGELRVLTISQDARGATLVTPFFAENGYERLEPWLDPENELAGQFTDGGQLPLTVLFDAEGRELFRVAGAYEWDSEEAIAMLREAIAESEG